MAKTICKHSVSRSKYFTDLEKVILGKMFDWEEWNEKNQSSDEETFIITNEAGLIELDAHELFHAINHLVELGILKRRDCDAVAYEWADRERIAGLI